MKPTVSILIPAYNAEEWIGDTIRSAMTQTWPNKEIIIVDDGSTDGTLEMARQYACENVLVTSQTNQGAAGARNKAFSLCQGDYIQWLDADDLIDPDKVALQMKAALEEGDPLILYSGEWAHFLYRVSRARFSPSPLWCDLSPTEWLIRKMADNCHMQTATWLVSRNLSEAAGLWDTTLLGDDDGEYFCRVKQRCKRIRFIPAAKVYYRLVSSNRLSYVGRSEKKKQAHLRSMRVHVDCLLAMEDSLRARAACLTYLQRYLHYFYPDHQREMDQLQQIAEGLGGRLEPPIVRSKYRGIQKLFGWTAARWTQDRALRTKWRILRYWDRAMFQIERWRELELIACRRKWGRSRKRGAQLTARCPRIPGFASTRNELSMRSRFEVRTWSRTPEMDGLAILDKLSKRGIV